MSFIGIISSESELFLFTVVWPEQMSDNMDVSNILTGPKQWHLLIRLKDAQAVTKQIYEGADNELQSLWLLAMDDNDQEEVVHSQFYLFVVMMKLPQSQSSHSQQAVLQMGVAAIISLIILLLLTLCDICLHTTCH